MTEFEAASLAAQHAATVAAYVVGGGQCLLIAGGLWLMYRATTGRDIQHAQRHTETMEVLRQQGDALRQQGDALRQQGDALRALTERTAPPS